MDLALDEAEADELRQILTSHLGDLRMQLADTDTSTFREQLRAEKQIVLRVLGKLGVDVAAAS